MTKNLSKDLRTCWQKFVILILQNIRTSLAKKNQQVLIFGVRLHFHEHFDQKSGFNMEIYITLHNKCIMLPLLKTAYLLAVNLVLLDFWSINAYYEGQIPFIAIS